MEPQKLERLNAQFERDARLDGVFVVLSLGASLIASLGLLANSTAVVIGAMVVAPWIMPLRAAAFAGLMGRWRLFGQAVRSLASGVLVLLGLSAPELRQQLGRSQLGWSSLVLTLLLLLPLGGSFIDLARKAQQTAQRQRISDTLKALLTDNRDLLGNQAYLADLRIDWQRQPALVVAVLRVRTPGYPTPEQVAQAETLINRHQAQRLRLVVERSTTELVLPR